jgi:hypothetical protein
MHEPTNLAAGACGRDHRQTPRAKSRLLDVPGWISHTAGQHVDVRLTAEDG